MKKLFTLLTIAAFFSLVFGQGGISGSSSASLTISPPSLLYGFPVTLNVNISLTGVTTPNPLGLGGFVVPTGFDKTKFSFYSATGLTPYSGTGGTFAFTDVTKANTDGFVTVVGATSDSVLAAPGVINVAKITGRVMSLGTLTFDLTSPASAPAQSALSCSSKWTSAGGGPENIPATGVDLTQDVKGRIVIPGGYNNASGRLSGGDFDNDLFSDYAICTPGTSSFSLICSTDGAKSVTWGANGDIPVPGDYDGDNKTDIAVCRPSTAYSWIIKKSSDSTKITYTWGQAGDIPVPADYDGDGITDIAVFRPSTYAAWIIRSSITGTKIQFTWGMGTDVPAPGDYDHDYIADAAVFRNGQWTIKASTTGTKLSFQWGQAGDMPVHGDYDGDGIMDYAVFRQPGSWVIRGSITGTKIQYGFGTTGDIPSPGFFDSDSKYDVGMYRPSTHQFIIRKSTDGTQLKTTLGTGVCVAVSR